MKLLMLLCLISVGFSSIAQKSIFVRVYDLNGKKTNKGSVFAVTDTSLLLVGKEAPTDIPVSRIGFIKTKRSPGNNILLGSTIGTSAAAILGALIAEPDDSNGFSIGPETPGEGAAVGAILGAPTGALIGALTIAAKKSKTFIVNGDLLKWKDFQSYIMKK